MSHFKKYILNSTTSVLNQVLDQTERFLFSYFLHRTDIKLKYLLKNIVKRNILFFSGICKTLRYKYNSRKIIRLSEVNWMPLIKASTTLSSAACTSSDCTCNEITIEHQINCSGISEKYVLCVGGRSRLYPEYRYLVESLGGKLLIYRGNQKGDTDQLPDILTCADMVICPVDCVNHETYFAVKYFCNKSGKPCVLLDRSDIPTFRKGIEVLIGISI